MDAQHFADRWLAAWNRHDVDAVLELFDDEIVFSSPLIARLGVSADGIVRGKAALREYWALGLRKLPDLHFELVGVNEGVDVLVIGFRNEQGVVRSEILKFREGLVIEGHGTYPVTPAA